MEKNVEFSVKEEMFTVILREANASNSDFLQFPMFQN